MWLWWLHITCEFGLILKRPGNDGEHFFKRGEVVAVNGGADDGFDSVVTRNVYPFSKVFCKN